MLKVKDFILLYNEVTRSQFLWMMQLRKCIRSTQRWAGVTCVGQEVKIIWVEDILPLSLK